MKRIRPLKKWIPLLAKVLAAAVAVTAWTVTSASATTPESAASTVNLQGVTLAANTSYISDEYFGVLHLNVGDDTVACASIDSKNRVVVTAVGPGATTVSFWYKKTVEGNWVSAVLPVTVSGTASVAKTVTSREVGLVFPQQSINMSPGSNYTVSGITLNGSAVEASTLLWMSSSDSVATVDRSSGKIHAASAGSATIYAIDSLTDSCASVTVVVS